MKMTTNIGSLTLVLGPMFSSKSTELIAQLTKYADLGFKCLYINSAYDTRDEIHFISSHNSSFNGLSQKIDILKVKKLSEIKEYDISQYLFIGIDEAQFYSDLLEYVIKWINHLNKNIIVVGLSGDIHKNKFGQIIDLIPYADSIIHKTAICINCLEENKNILVNAPFTVLKTDAEFNEHTSVNVGDSQKYKAVCRKHATGKK